MIEIKNEIVSSNYVSFSATILESTSDRLHFYTQTPQIRDTKETQNAFFKESHSKFNTYFDIIYQCYYQRQYSDFTETKRNSFLLFYFCLFLRVLCFLKHTVYNRKLQKCVRNLDNRGIRLNKKNDTHTHQLNFFRVSLDLTLITVIFK